MTTLTCSSCSSTGHEGRLSGSTSIWRSGTARCLTYAQQWTRWETSLASCPACTPCQAATPSPTVAYGNGKKSALKVLVNNDIDCMQDVLVEPDIIEGQLRATTGVFFMVLYGQKKIDSLNIAKYKIYMSRKKPPPLKKLPPTDSKLQLHVLRAHLQIMLWKAADQRHPPFDARDIRRFGWYVTEGATVTPSVSNVPVALHGLLVVVSCSCSAERKACSEKRCSCHSAGLSCKEYCYCKGRCVLQSLQ